MQFKYLLIGSIVLHTHVQSIPNVKFLNDASEFLFHFFYEAYGAQDASSEVQNYVRTLLKKSGIAKADAIRIKQLSTIGKHSAGERNVIIAGVCGFPRVLFISQEWFQSLSDEQKQFVIMQKLYEFSSYKNEVNVFINGFIPLCLDCYDVFDVSENGWHISLKDKSRWLAYGAKCAISTFLFSLVYALNARILHYFTYYADEKAAKKIGSTKGALELFKAMEKADDQEESQLVQMPFFKTKRTIISTLFDTNPSWQERIAQLQSVAKK